MSTQPTPGQSTQPATGWYPNLGGLNLPSALTNGMQQSYSLIYSLRDTQNQLQQTVQNANQYGTHLQRTQTNAQTVPDAALFFELDRATVFYQARLQPSATTRAWFYAGGIMYGALPQPSDLGLNDLGFLFLDSGANQLYRWNGSAWVIA